MTIGRLPDHMSISHLALFLETTTYLPVYDDNCLRYSSYRVGSTAGNE